MSVPEHKKALIAGRWVKFSLGLVLFAVFGVVGIGALSEQRWEAMPLGLIFSVLSAYSLYRTVVTIRAPRDQGGQ